METSKAVSAWYTDKALYVTVLSLLLPYVSQVVDVPLDPFKVAGALLVAVAYVVGHKWKSGAVLLAELELEAKKLAGKYLGPDEAAKAPPVDASAAPKVVASLILLGMLAVPLPAHAGGFDWSTGPTVPFLEYDFGHATPVQVAPGAGLQLSLTHDALKQELFGKTWDLFDLQLSAFGSVVRADSPASFGVLGVSVGVCAMSSLLCAGIGRHLLGPDFVFQGGGWFGVLSLNFNFAVSPSSAQASFDRAHWGLPRGNTLYVVGGQ